MNGKFHHIGLIGKHSNPEVEGVISAISEQLAKHQITTILDTETARHIQQPDLETLTRDEMGQRCDLVIVIGGDGTMLNAARSLCQYGIPLVGINLGRLGFLADISPDETESRLEEILNGEYQVEERFLLQAEVVRDQEVIFTAHALNDVVVHKWEAARLIEYDTFIDDHFMHRHRSDGVIISTPTGSTAYALSAGGPIIQPGLEAVTVVPICPHTLSDRPIVVRCESDIRIIVSEGGHNEGQLTCDGQFVTRLRIGDEIRIAPLPKRLQLLHPKDYNYYQILRAKLRWAENP